MTTLKNLKGTAIQFLDADPVQYAGSWSSGGSVNTARQYGAGIGSSTAGLIFGGSTGSNSAVTEQYNGTAWTEVNDLNAVQIAQASAGTLTSGMSAVGAVAPGANVEDWNGTVWAANPHSLNSARQFSGGDGVSNDSVLVVGGEPAPNGALTEVYNGSTWAESGDLNTARNQLAAAGTVTALLAMGGNTGADAETFNGTSWTAVTDMNSGRGGLSGSGTSTLALAFAGNPDVASTESWNGSAWTEVNNLSTGREFGASSNITGNTTAFLASGNTTTLVSNTEEWSFPAITATILNEGDMWFNSSSSTLKGYGTAAGVPAGTWASGGSMNNSREGGCGFGTQTAGVAAGGDSPGLYVEHYDGSSWASQSNMPTRGVRGGATGTQTAGIIYGMGHAPSGGSRADCFTYNGSSWTEISDLNSARNNGASAGGLQTSALYAGGVPPTVATCEIWDGSSWTEVGDLNAARYSLVGGGTTTAAIVAGGYGGTPTTNPTQSEVWNGTSWTETSELTTGRAFLTGGGNDSTQVILFGGGPFPSPPAGTTNKTEFWNGSSWTELNDMASVSETSFGTTQGAGVGTYRASGRIAGSVSAATEEWNVDAAVSTLTTS